MECSKVYETFRLTFINSGGLYHSLRWVVVAVWLLSSGQWADFSRGRSGGLVFPALSEFSTVYCPLLIATEEAIPLRGLEGVPCLPGAPQDEAGLTRKFER